MANSITGCRILLSVIMLFSQAFSPLFYICYLMAGFTDMIDGGIARMLGTESEFGEKLDTVADMIFFTAAAIKILPALHISRATLIWISIIAVVKIANVVYGIAKYRRFVPIHSIANKAIGVLMFAFPLTITIVQVRYSTTAVCAVATMAAVQEGHLIRKTVNPDL